MKESEASFLSAQVSKCNGTAQHPSPYTHKPLCYKVISCSWLGITFSLRTNLYTVCLEGNRELLIVCGTTWVWTAAKQTKRKAALISVCIFTIDHNDYCNVKDFACSNKPTENYHTTFPSAVCGCLVSFGSLFFVFYGPTTLTFSHQRFPFFFQTQQQKVIW